MSDELHRFVTTLLSPTAGVHLDKVTVEQDTVWLQLTDLPWGTCTVRLQLRVRKFVCQKPPCERRIFTERLPELVAASARKTRRLIAVLRAIGVALGGNAGARPSMPTSNATRHPAPDGCSGRHRPGS